MDSPPTIPPGVRITFEKYALRVCLQADVDEIAFQDTYREICNDLEKSWLEGIKNNLTTEDAEREALKGLDAGSFATTVALRKRPLFTRLLFFSQYRGIRFITIAAFAAVQMLVAKLHVDYLATAHFTFFTAKEFEGRQVYNDGSMWGLFFVLLPLVLLVLAQRIAPAELDSATNSTIHERGQGGSILAHFMRDLILQTWVYKSCCTAYLLMLGYYGFFITFRYATLYFYQIPFFGLATCGMVVVLAVKLVLWFVATLFVIRELKVIRPEELRRWLARQT